MICGSNVARPMLPPIFRRPLVVRTEHELEDAFDTNGAGIGEQLAQDGLQVHGGHSCGFLVLAGNEGLEQKFSPHRRVIDRCPNASQP
ncbi:hypothetical protein SRABI06_00776 [Pseudomonas brassicacearum]|nr:hypothetical protein SRABI06_00776 [Pseudomonas brassicacearum]